MIKQELVILGAGLAGLSAAWHAAGAATVFEQAAVPGGLARSYREQDFTFDCAGHLLHCKTEPGRRLIETLLADELVRHERNAWIYSHATYTPYPFQASTCGLPAHIVKQCILGMVNGQRAAGAHPDATLHDWLLANFGEGITRHFLYPYNSKFWTVPPEQLLPDWAQRFVPLVGIRDVINGAFTTKIKHFGYNAFFWYPRQGGIDRLVAALCQPLKTIRCGRRAVGLDLRQNIISFADGSSCHYRRLISTLPLPELGAIITTRLPAAIRRAFSRLRYISIYNLNIGIEGRIINDKHWLYYPEKNICFFRVGFPMNFSNRMVPPGASSLYAEVSYSDWQPLARKGIQDRIIQDLRRVGILRAMDRIILQQVIDMPYAYVLYDRNYRRSVALIETFLREQDIYLCGRFGRWQYMSMEDALLDGKQVAEQVI